MKTFKFTPKSSLFIIIAVFAASLGNVGATYAATNDNINISKDDLREACKNSGGTFTEWSDGDYGCEVTYDDGTIIIACGEDETCEGTGDRPRQITDDLHRNTHNGVSVRDANIAPPAPVFPRDPNFPRGLVQTELHSLSVMTLAK